MNSSRIAGKLRRRIARFSGDVSNGLCLAAQRFVAEMLYGIQASGSVLLTEIGRSLEEDISIKKTEERLSRNLMRPQVEKRVGDNVLRMGAAHIGQDTLLIVDPSDLSKKYARKMQYLARVRDGSAHDLANGYWTLHIVGADLESDKIVPLYQRLWSQNAPDFVSENEEILRGVDAVMAHVGHRGIFVYDRGGDRINLFAPLLDRKARFLIRLVGNRHLVHNHKTQLARDLAQTCPCRFAKTITRIDGEKEKVYHLSFGFRKVRLPDRSEPLYLLVIHGFGSEPLLLLAVMFFAACILDHDARLRVMAGFVEKAAKRVFGIPDFKYYALADGLRAIFCRHPGSPVSSLRDPPPNQMTLFDSGYS